MYLSKKNMMEGEIKTGRLHGQKLYVRSRKAFHMAGFQCSKGRIKELSLEM